MHDELLVDVGNSRMKWGRCRSSVEMVSLPTDDAAAWAKQLDAWRLPPSSWILTGSNPRARAQLGEWLHGRGHSLLIIESPDDLPLTVKLERPDHVGIDRLLNAVAANMRRKPGKPAVIVDAGTAVTVDWVDAEGAFCGGAIFPGLRLMSKALHDYTALLPLVEIKSPMPAVPAVATPAAVEAGVYWAVVGGIRQLMDRLDARREAAIFLGGGDATLLAPAFDASMIVWPEMTLEGVRLAAKHKRESA